MSPDVLFRTAALGALSAAAALTPPDPDFAPLIGAQVFLGQTWPSQSSTPGAAAMPNQLLIYGWDEESETIANKTTAPQFETVLTVVIEARVEVKQPAASASLPSQPSPAAIAAAVDGALAALCFAVKKAVCQGIALSAMALNGGTPALAGIKSVKIAGKYAEAGQRISSNGAVAFELLFEETFEPLIPNALDEVAILINPEAGGLANSGNTGNGTISAVTVALGAEAGAYAVRFTSSTAFAVTMPDGSSAGSGTVGTGFAGGGLAFTISAGTHAFAIGDGFTVTVQVAAENLLNLSS